MGNGQHRKNIIRPKLQLCKVAEPIKVVFFFAEVQNLFSKPSVLAWKIGVSECMLEGPAASGV